MTESKDQQGVDAVLVTGQILDALVALPRPARLRDIELATGLAAAKIHRYLVSMVRCGLVRRQEHGNRYDFGLLAYRVGQEAAHNDSVISLLEPLLSGFAKELDRAIGIGQWLGYGATIVRWFELSTQLTLRLRPGVNLTISGSANGKLLAAHQPREVTEPLVRGELLESGAAGKARIDAVYREYKRIRDTGIAASESSRRDGLNALSVPLLDREGHVIFALTVVGMAPGFEAATEGKVANRMKAMAAELSAALGGARDSFDRRGAGKP